MKPLLFMSILLVAGCCLAQECKDYNGMYDSPGTYVGGASGSGINHVVGSHYDNVAGAQGSCHFVNSTHVVGNQVECNSQDYLHTGGTPRESIGSVTYGFRTHTIGAINIPESSPWTLGASSVNAASQGAVEDCNGVAGCPPPYFDLNGGVHWQPGEVILDQWSVVYTNSCPDLWHTHQFTPIVIATGDGKYKDAFTSVADGVKFAYNGTDSVQTAWVSPSFEGGFLYFDRYGDGAVTGRQFFGDMTPGSLYGLGNEKQPNGFTALRASDDPAGYTYYYPDAPNKATTFFGNGDGKITAADGIWKSLRVFFYGSNSFSTLDELGITELGLNYHPVGAGDKYGNKLNLCSTLVRNGKRETYCDVEFAK